VNSKQTTFTACQAGFTKPLGTGPVRLVLGGSGPARYTNRFGSHSQTVSTFFLTPANGPVSPVYRSVFLNRGELVRWRFGEPAVGYMLSFIHYRTSSFVIPWNILEYSVHVTV
jgi:hypothetical protein